MQAFINKTGELNEINCGHVTYCQVVLNISLADHLRDNVRVLQYRETLAIETDQKRLTTAQLKTIRKLYHQSECFTFAGRINKKLINDVKQLLLN